MTDKEKRYWAYFLNLAGEIQYYEICLKCKRDCKQSFRIVGLRCNKFEARQRKRHITEMDFGGMSLFA